HDMPQDRLSADLDHGFGPDGIFLADPSTMPTGKNDHLHDSLLSCGLRGPIAPPRGAAFPPPGTGAYPYSRHPSAGLKAAARTTRDDDARSCGCRSGAAPSRAPAATARTRHRSVPGTWRGPPRGRLTYGSRPDRRCACATSCRPVRFWIIHRYT